MNYSYMKNLGISSPKEMAAVICVEYIAKYMLGIEKVFSREFIFAKTSGKMLRVNISIKAEYPEKGTAKC